MSVKSALQEITSQMLACGANGPVINLSDHLHYGLDSALILAANIQADVGGEIMPRNYNDAYWLTIDGNEETINIFYRPKEVIKIESV